MAKGVSIRGVGGVMNASVLEAKEKRLKAMIERVKEVKKVIEKQKPIKAK